MVDKYYYFSARVKISDVYFDLVFDTEKGIDDSSKKPLTVHLYNIKDADGGRGAHTRDSKLPLTSYNTTISQSGENVKLEQRVYIDGQEAEVRLAMLKKSLFIQRLSFLTFPCA
jgi:hypothetical protein